MYKQAIITNDDRRAIRNTNKVAITYPVRTNEGLLHTNDVQMVLTMSNKTSSITISSATKTRVITPDNPDYRKVVNILNGNY